MILSDIDIKNAIDSNLIAISPFEEEKIGMASYAFTLGAFLLSSIDNRLVDFKNDLLPEYLEIKIDENGYRLEPGQFILGQTLEKITLSPSIAMTIEGRSAIARIGVEITQTSSFIEPDHTDSIITLEIKNNGNNPFMLYSGMKFAKGVFSKLTSNSTGQFDKSDYTTQTKVTGPNISSDYF